jgi:hypothetical protein
MASLLARRVPLAARRNLSSVSEHASSALGGRAVDLTGAIAPRAPLAISARAISTARSPIGWESATSSALSSSSSSALCAPSSADSFPSSSSSSFTSLQTRAFHATARAESTVLIAGLSVAATALAARYAIQAFSSNSDASAAPGKAGEEGAGSEAGAGAGAAKKKEEPQRSQKGMGAEFWARQLYTGGFEDAMTRREAALILGIR